jgi:hypothetical protein
VTVILKKKVSKRRPGTCAGRQAGWFCRPANLIFQIKNSSLGQGGDNLGNCVCYKRDKREPAKSGKQKAGTKCIKQGMPNSPETKERIGACDRDPQLSRSSSMRAVTYCVRIGVCCLYWNKGTTCVSVLPWPIQKSLGRLEAYALL